MNQIQLQKKKFYIRISIHLHLQKNIQEFIDYLKHFGYDASFEQELGASGYNTCFSQEYGGVEKLINIGEIARRGNLVISWKDEVQNIKETKGMV